VLPPVTKATKLGVASAANPAGSVRKQASRFAKPASTRSAVPASAGSPAGGGVGAGKPAPSSDASAAPASGVARSLSAAGGASSPSSGVGVPGGSAGASQGPAGGLAAGGGLLGQGGGRGEGEGEGEQRQAGERERAAHGILLPVTTGRRRGDRYAASYTRPSRPEAWGASARFPSDRTGFAFRGCGGRRFRDTAATTG